MHDPHDDSMAFLAPPCKNRYMTEGTSAPTQHANITNTQQWAMALSIVEKGPQLRYNKHTSAKVWPKSVAIASWSWFLHVRRTYLLLPLIYTFDISTHDTQLYTNTNCCWFIQTNITTLTATAVTEKEHVRSFFFGVCCVNSMTLEAPKIIRRRLCSFLRS